MMTSTRLGAVHQQSLTTMTSNGAQESVARGIKNGWFSEVDSMLPGQKFSLALQVLRHDVMLVGVGAK